MKTLIITLVTTMMMLASSCGNAKTKSKTTATSPETNTTQVVAGTNTQPSEGGETAVASGPGKPVMLTRAMFLEKVYDFEKNPNTWVYKDNKPCIIDFYADWCRPCRMVAPIMEEFARDYDGQITIYKIDTDKERELAGYFGIRSIPSVLFCPVNGKPQMTQGALPKEEFQKIINEVLLNQNSK